MAPKVADYLFLDDSSSHQFTLNMFVFVLKILMNYSYISVVFEPLIWTLLLFIEPKHLPVLHCLRVMAAIKMEKKKKWWLRMHRYISQSVLAVSEYIVRVSLVFSLRLPQTQSQFRREGNWPIAAVSSSRAAFQRQIQHAKRKTSPAGHLGQVQKPDRRGGGEENRHSSLLASVTRHLCVIKVCRFIFCHFVAAGERALRLWVAKVSGKCSGGLC